MQATEAGTTSHAHAHYSGHLCRAHQLLNCHQACRKIEQVGEPHNPHTVCQCSAYLCFWIERNLKDCKLSQKPLSRQIVAAAQNACVVCSKVPRAHTCLLTSP